uniref:beta strand repeat-containing protein n=1 Tax=Psychromonas sp. 14N.309.X.WAT.B.A12 TaxID=2998322 RepID=UPI0025AF5A1D
SVDSIITNDTTPAITGTIDDPTAAVVVTVNDIEYTATNNGNGTWTLADNELAALTEGEIAVSVVATDTANNSSDVATGTITVDLIAPTVAVTSITTNDTTPAITGTIDDPTAAVVVTVNDIEYTATNNGNGTWTLADNELAALTEGDIAVSVVATDTANNSSDVATGTITIDLTAPTVDDLLLTVDESNLATTVSVSGSLTISEELSNLTLIAPTDVYTSQGEAVTWTLTTGAQNTQILTGSTSSGDVAILSLDSDGNYNFDLVAPLDHIAQGSDELTVAFGVEATDLVGNIGETAQLVVNVIDDIASVIAYQQEVVDTVNTLYSGDIVVNAGADGVEVSTITIDGYTFSYDTDSNLITTYGSSDIVNAFEETDYDTDTQILTIDTIKGETITVDLASGEYSYTTTGVADVEATVESSPEVALGADNSLLGLVGVDALNLIDFSSSQAFSAIDANNDITQVVISTESISVNLGYAGFKYSIDMAKEFGLKIVTDDLGFLIGTTASIIITSLDDSTITNQQLNEFLGSVYWKEVGVSLGVLPTLTITATDSEGNAVSSTNSDLASLGLLSTGDSPDYLFEGDDNANTNTSLTGSERIYGYGGNDTLNGGEGADLLRGGAGNDILDGGTGNDILIGGIGNDTLTGGTGNDVFRWETVDVASVDTITDFEMGPVAGGADIIDLAELLNGEGKIGTSGAGNLSNFLHFEFDGTDTTLYISADGDFQGGYTTAEVDQSIIFSGVDITEGLSTDQDIIENLLANGNLLVDDLALGDDVLGGTTTIDIDLVDGDGDISQATVDFESSGAAPEVISNVDNTAPIVCASNTSLLGLVAVQALDIINLDNQALTAIDIDGNLTSVEVNYQALLDVSLTELTLAASNEMAAELGLQIEVSNNSGLLGLVAASSTLTITAVDGGTIDNQSINELLATVQFYDNEGLLGGALELNVQADVLNNLTITATDSEGASSSGSLGDLVSADALNDILFDIDTVKEGDSGQNEMDYGYSSSGLRLYGYGDNDVLIGGSGNDLIRGGSGDDNLIGGAGNDMLIDGSGSDTFSGGDGDDLISISGGQFESIDGGEGSDTLMLDDGLDLDLSDANIGAITNIETIDLSEGETGNVLKLTEEAVKALTDEEDTLTINGDANDSVDMEGATFAGSSVVNGVAYNEYHLGTTTLYVDEEIGTTI